MNQTKDEYKKALFKNVLFKIKYVFICSITLLYNIICIWKTQNEISSIV